MSRIKEHYFNEINKIDDVIDAEYSYQIWLDGVKSIEGYCKENEEKFESEKIFRLTNTYPF